MAKKIKTVAVRLPIRECPVGKFLQRFEELTIGDPEIYEVESQPSTPPSEPANNADDDSCINLVLEDNEKYLKSLDPSDWKEHDHYKVLGLQSKRMNATVAEIKAAYRQLVLKHHPDKRKVPLDQRQTDYFPALVKSFELLSNPKKRISYDSVDPHFDDSIPKSKNISAENFLTVLGPVFERNAKWSVKKPVPLLGNDNTNYDDLMNFYKFWLNFDSWREYSYLDEEEKEKGADREERRYLDKLNKAERQRRKNAEISRIRQLVDCAMANDPRIKRKREEETKRKLEEKEKRRQAAVQRENTLLAESEAQKREEEERKQREAAEAEEAKKEREMAKKEIKAQRKLLRDVCKKFDYFCKADDIEGKTWWMEGIDSVCVNYSLDELKAVNANVKPLSGKEKELKSCLKDVINKQNEDAENKKKDEILQQQKAATASQSNQNNSSNSSQSGDSWTTEEIQCLVKALQLLPPGTDKRWIAISNFINNHIHNGQQVKTQKQVISKAKNLQNLNNSDNVQVKSQIKQKAAETLTGGEANPATNGVPMTNGDTSSKPAASTPEFQSAPTERTQDTIVWSAHEQKLLEAALKNYPPDTEARWERISEAVPGKTKKECMKRYKEIVELLKAKKAAQTSKASTANK